LLPTDWVHYNHRNDNIRIIHAKWLEWYPSEFGRNHGVESYIILSELWRIPFQSIGVDYSDIVVSTIGDSMIVLEYWEVLIFSLRWSALSWNMQTSW
jgi:hypothetical protein